MATSCIALLRVTWRPKTCMKIGGVLKKFSLVAVVFLLSGCASSTGYTAGTQVRPCQLPSEQVQRMTDLYLENGNEAPNQNWETTVQENLECFGPIVRGSQFDGECSLDSAMVEKLSGILDEYKYRSEWGERKDKSNGLGGKQATRGVTGNEFWGKGVAFMRNFEWAKDQSGCFPKSKLDAWQTQADRVLSNPDEIAYMDEFLRNQD